MTYEEILKIFKEKEFQNIRDIEEYFQQFGFECEIDCCQWDDVSYVFTSPSSDAFFSVSVDPYCFFFHVYIWKNENEDYCTIFYDTEISRKKIEIYEYN